MPSRWHLLQRQRYACQCIPRLCCCEKGIEFGWHWPEPTQACLSGTRQKGTPKLTVYREAQRASYLDLPVKAHDPSSPGYGVHLRRVSETMKVSRTGFWEVGMISSPSTRFSRLFCGEQEALGMPISAGPSAPIIRTQPRRAWL
jgi:hypothetical protein